MHRLLWVVLTGMEDRECKTMGRLITDTILGSCHTESTKRDAKRWAFFSFSSLVVFFSLIEFFDSNQLTFVSSNQHSPEREREREKRGIILVETDQKKSFKKIVRLGFSRII